MLTFIQFLESMSRRSFLGTAAATMASPLLSQGADFKDFQNMPVDPSTKGKDYKETNQLLHLLYPRNQNEENQLREFAFFVYGAVVETGESLRPMIEKYLTMPKERQEDEYFRFLLKYARGKLPVPVDQPRKVSQALTGSSVEMDVQGSPTNIVYDKNQGKKFLTPSVIMRHEIDHVYQGGMRTKNAIGELNKDRYEFNPERQISESLAALYDIGSLVVVDQKLRQDSNLSLKNDKQGQPLYKLNITFPSGQEIQLGTLAIWARQGGVATLQNPKSAMQIFAKYARYIESLIYGKRTQSVDRTYQNQQKPSKQVLENKYRELYFQKLKKDFEALVKDFPDQFPNGIEAEAKKYASKASYEKMVKELRISDDPYYYGFGNPGQDYTVIPR